MDQETLEFLEQLETENGGPIIFKTYAALQGTTEGKTANLGGLLYVVNSLLIFEDFEKQPGMMELLSRKRSTKYVKLKMAQPISAISSIRIVRKTLAERALEKKSGIKLSALPAIGKIEQLFFQTALLITFSDDTAWIMEVLEPKAVITFLEEAHESI